MSTVKVLSLRKTLITGTFLSIILPSVILGIFEICSSERNFKIEEQNRLLHFLNTFSSIVSFQLWNMDRPAISQSMDSAMFGSEIISVTLRDPDRKIFLSRQKDVNRTDRVINGEIKVFHEDELLGYLSMELSLDKNYMLFMNGMFKRLVLAIFQFGISFIFIWFLFEIRLVRPLLMLQKEVSRISSGDLNHSIAPLYNDEIGNMVTGIDGMRKRLAALYTQSEITITELRVAREGAEKASILKSRFLDVAAHELRTPVTAFSLLLQLAKKQLERGVAVETTTLDRLLAQASRISSLVVDLLDVSRFERKTAKLDLSRQDLNSIVNECVEDFLLRQPSRNVLICQSDASVEFKFDNLRIRQVINNLLENVLKYTPENSPIEILVEKKEACARVAITDHGPGISDEQRAVLFTALSRGDTKLTTRSGGLGLGLYISSEIVKLHGGTIGVTSRVGSGSTFYFELPTENSIQAASQ